MSTLPKLQSFPAKTSTPRGNVLVLHGYAEYAGRFTQVIRAFQAADFDVWAYDQRNHGITWRNAGGYKGEHAVVDVQELVADHLALRQQIAQQARVAGLVLFGHSMGGLVSAASALQDPTGLHAVVLSGPAFLQFPAVPAWLARLAMPLARVLPSLPIAGLDTSKLAQNPQVVQDFQADPLNYQGKVPFLTGTSMALVGHNTLANCDEWDAELPLMIFHGSADGLANVEGSRIIAKRTRGVLEEIPGGYHEIFQGEDAPELLQRTISWLEQQGI